MAPQEGNEGMADKNIASAPAEDSCQDNLEHLTAHVEGLRDRILTSDFPRREDYIALLETLNDITSRLSREDAADLLVKRLQVPLLMGNLLQRALQVVQPTKAHLGFLAHSLREYASHFVPETGSRWLEPSVAVSTAQQCCQSGVLPSLKAFSAYLAEPLTSDRIAVAHVGWPAGDTVQLCILLINLMRSLCSMWPGGILKSKQASAALLPAVKLAGELMHVAMNPADHGVGISDQELSMLLSSSCSMGFSVVQQLAAKLAAGQDVAGLLADPCCAELLAYNPSPRMPPFLVLVLFVMMQQLLHHLKYSKYRGMSLQQVYKQRLQNAAQATDDALLAAKYRQTLEQLLTDGNSHPAGSAARRNGAAHATRINRAEWQAHMQQQKTALKACNTAALWLFPGSSRPRLQVAADSAAAGVTMLSAACSCSTCVSSEASGTGTSDSSGSTTIDSCDVLQHQLNRLCLAAGLPAAQLELWIFAPPPGMPWIEADKLQSETTQLTQMVGKHVTDTAGLVTTLQVLGALMKHFKAAVTEADYSQANKRDISMLGLLLQLPSLLLSVALSFIHDGALAAAAVRCAKQAHNAVFSAAEVMTMQVQAAPTCRTEQPPAALPRVITLPTNFVVPPVVQLLQRVLQLEDSSTRVQQQQQVVEEHTAEDEAAAAAAAATHCELWTGDQKQEVLLTLMDFLQVELGTYSRHDWTTLPQQLAVVMEAYARTLLAPLVASVPGSPAAEAAKQAVAAMHTWHKDDFTAAWQHTLAQCLCPSDGALLLRAAAADEAKQQLLLSLLLSATKFYLLPVSGARLDSLPLERGDLLAAAARMAEMLSQQHGSSSSSSSNIGQLPASVISWVALAARVVIAHCRMVQAQMAHDFYISFSGEGNDEEDWLDGWTCALNTLLRGLSSAAKVLNHMCLGQLPEAAAAAHDSCWGTKNDTCEMSEPEPAADAAAVAGVAAQQTAPGVSLAELLPSYACLQAVVAALECAEKLGEFANQWWGGLDLEWEYTISSSQGSMVREEVALLARVFAADSRQAKTQVIKESFIWQLPTRLAAVAEDVAAFLPTRHCCNNPFCSNMSGMSELQLVGGKSCVCGGCKTARYCSAACQHANWAKHKPVCKKIQAAAAAHPVSAAAAPPQD